jgi:hypothetical protein
MPLPLLDGTIHYQPFLINQHAADTIMSPEHILNNNNRFASWQQEGRKISSGLTTSHPGSLSFFDFAGTLLLSLPPHQQDGLYYCSHTALLPGDGEPAGIQAYQLSMTLDAWHSNQPYHKPTTHAQQLTSKLWALQMGHCGHRQLILLPKCVDGTPTVFLPHPFRFDDSKEQARVQKQPTGHDPEKALEPKMRFFMDIGFMQSSRSNYHSPRLGINRVVECFKGYSVYLIIVDESSRYVWVFLQKSKELPIDLVLAFLTIHGSPDGG